MARRPARKKPAPARTAKKRPAPRKKKRGNFDTPKFEMPVLEQYHKDLIGLGLLALAAFFAFVFYLGWNGGEVGDALKQGFVFLLGNVAYFVPVVLLGAGALMVLGPLLPTVRPFRAGTACVLSALMLGLAAGSLGLGPGAASEFFEPDFFEDRGGLGGDALYFTTTTLFQDVGTHIIFTFLLVGGILLLTGGSVAGIVAATREGVAATTRRVKQSTGEFAAVVTGRERAAPADLTVAGTDPMEVPEVEPNIQATHVEAPALDGDEPTIEDEWGLEEPAEYEPELITEPEPDPEPVAAEDPPEYSQEQLTPQGRLRGSVTEADDFVYTVPSAKLLKRNNGKQTADPKGEARVAAQLTEALAHFGVESKLVGTVSGPHVTRYELRLGPGIKMSKVAGLKDDLAYALAASDVRILAPIPGKQAVGVEVPNAVKRTVYLGDVLQDAPAGWSPLTVWLGKDISGKAIGTDLAKQPHVLIAGTTGSGKSGCVNAMLSSILLRATPNEVKLVLVDPKQVELNLYESIPHLLTPVVTSPRMAANVLQNLIKEMEERYSIMSLARARNLVELNKIRVKKGEKPLPYILCVIDELADLMMIAPADVEDAIIRLAQKSRAVGIHLLLATQRPSADIITGMIKANVPARIAFAVSSQTDSRVILDQNGAESLLGKGDMLFRPATESRPARIQGALVTEDEIEKLTAMWRRQGEPEIHEELLEAPEVEEETDKGDFDPDADDMLGEAIATVVQLGSASTSMLQRRLRVGYTRAGRLIDMMERRGVISGYEGSKARQVLITEADLPRVLENLEEGAHA
ncbi:MAG: DNA translocase FtsK [Thermoleophilaceae bacterium]|nr:DNA translocase FtsK [Thermoleophilaceae bacterium]